MKDVHLEYEKDPCLLAEIISALPMKMESTLNLHRSRLLGSLPKTRDEFDPASLLSKLDGGEKVLVCDSNVDLPKDWMDVDLRAFVDAEVNAPNDDHATESGSEGLSSGSASVMTRDRAFQCSSCQ